MVRLEAGEAHYFVWGSPAEALELRRIPAGRWNATKRGWQYPRQGGVVLALDRVFGVGRWEVADEAAAIDVGDARGRRYPPAQNDVHVTLVGNQLAVECTIADKELMKLVPGYRWMPAQRRWYLPASPFSLVVLRERCGARLHVSQDAEEYIELTRIEDERAIEAMAARLARVADSATGGAPPAEPIQLMRNLRAEPVRPESPALATGLQDRTAEAAGDGLAARIERLSVAVDRLTAMIDGLGETLRTQAGRSPAAQVATPVDSETGLPPADPAAEEVRLSPGDWKSVLEASDDPQVVLDQARRQLQTAHPGEEAEARAAVGIAAARARQFDEALSHLRVLNGPRSIEAELAALAEGAYLQAVFGLINAECGPERPIETATDFHDLLFAELGMDKGFDEGAIASDRARTRLEFFVTDRVLARISADVSGYCRVAHLLGRARGAWMPAAGVADVLRDSTLTGDAFALAVLLFGNAAHRAKCVQEWWREWPSDVDTEVASEVPYLLERAALLERVGPELAAEAALCLLSLAAGAPVSAATVAQRRGLARIVAQASDAGKAPYAQFLAAFPLAAAGEDGVATSFPGYVSVLQQTSLEQSVEHLTSVFWQSSSGPASTARALAEQVLLPAIHARGVTDPKTQVVELLPLLRESPRADNLLNELAAAIEDGAFPGAALFTHEHRKAVYQAAFDEALSKRHDRDAVDAFDRLHRELRAAGEGEELRAVCAGLRRGILALRLPALVVRLGSELEDRKPFEDTLGDLLHFRRTGESDENVAQELAGLMEVYPDLREACTRLDPGTPPELPEEPDFAGRRIVLFGGHDWLRKQALPVLERWNVDVEWLDSDSAKNGKQARGLAEGNASLVVINTRCIGHAASGRLADAARGFGVVYQQSRGVGSMLSEIRTALRRLESPEPAAPNPTKLTKARERRKMLR